MQLNEVRAVVTGGVSGLGFAVAEHLVKNGGKVALFDVNDDKAPKPSPRSAPATRSTSAPTSATRPTCGQRRRREGIPGRLNVAVNCAWHPRSGPRARPRGPDAAEAVRDHRDGEPGRQLQRRQGRGDLMQHNAPGEDGERGVIINTASVAAYEGQIGQAAYSRPRAAWSA
jgi:NAD(P)-dependent dehydrogenase (short-subunit alcohol dehydrogenase family)